MAKKVRANTERPGKPAPDSRTRLAILAAVSAVGVALAGWLTWIHVRLVLDPAAKSACNLGGTLDCDAVNASRFATVAGVPIAWAGLSLYLLLLVLAVRERKGVARKPRALAYARWLGLASVLYSVYLGLVSALVIRAVCLFCVGLYAINLGIFLVGLRASGSRWRDFTPLRDLDALVRRSPGWAKAVAVAWLVGGLALVVVERRASRLELPTIAVGTAGPIAAIPGQTDGPEGAALTVALFSDFECPYCRDASDSLDRVRETHGDRVRFVYKHFPLDPACNRGTPRGGHRRACDAAEAAICAGEQGKFWEFHEAVFRLGAEEPRLREAAAEVGLDPVRWSQCRALGRTREAVRADVEDGLRLNVQSTPTFLIGDQLVPGALSAEQLGERIDRQLGGGAR
jgi:protein-disulfide isomerase/uncharacterized membrane protein